MPNEPRIPMPQALYDEFGEEVTDKVQDFVREQILADRARHAAAYRNALAAAQDTEVPNGYCPRLAEERRAGAQRVADFIAEHVPAAATGTDPIGFVRPSHAESGRWVFVNFYEGRNPALAWEPVYRTAEDATRGWFAAIELANERQREIVRLRESLAASPKGEGEGNQPLSMSMFATVADYEAARAAASPAPTAEPEEHPQFVTWTWYVWASGGRWKAKYGWKKPAGNATKLRPLFAAPVAAAPTMGPWQIAVDTALVDHGLDCTTLDTDPREAVSTLLRVATDMALDPAVSERAQALIARGAAPMPPQAETALPEAPPGVAAQSSNLPLSSNPSSLGKDGSVSGSAGESQKGDAT